MIKTISKLIIGIILIFVFHIPKLIYHGLMVSYTSVFNNQQNLTADPKEHLKRANRLLKKNRNSLLLYSALELRFALERIVHNQLIFAEEVSNRMLDEYDPTKKRKNMSRIDEDSDHPHKIYLIEKDTGKRFEWGEYRPIDQKKVNEIQGRLGNLLHPKDGLKLGISDDPWYIDTRKFLEETHDYLTGITDGNEYYFSYRGLQNFDMVKS
jgi:hypothetical protein